VLDFISGVDSIYVSILIGIVAATIFQSSTAISVLAITFASQGILNFDQAFCIVIGSGVGTTVTALIASIVMNTASQRTAFAHLWFNVMSVIITIIIFEPIRNTILYLNTSVGQSVANAHLLMSIITAIVLLLMFGVYVKFVELVVPDKGFFHKTRAAIHNKI